MFELAPVSLWLEDLSGMRALMDQWRAQGVVDIEAFLRAEPARVAACFAEVRLVKVNRRTLTLYEADSIEHLANNLAIVFQSFVFDKRVDELGKFWRGVTQYSSPGVNHALGGRRLDIQVSVTILPGHEHDWARVLVAIEDVTEREAAYRAQQRSESYFRGLFEHSPVSLWVQDFTRVKAVLDGLRDAGVTDLEAYLGANPDVPGRCMDLIRIRDVNARTLAMFKAPSLSVLISRVAGVFRAESHLAFMHLLIALWNGKPFDQEEMITYALDGSRIHVQVRCSVLSAHREDLSSVFVALSDITARKEAEAYLQFLNVHDPVTQLFNRSFYVEELRRLEEQRVFPVSIVVVDLNGLKQVNDRIGHAAGDALLRRCGEILTAAAGTSYHAARIGGDEFVILMPFAGAAEAAAMVDTLTGSSDREPSCTALSLAIGAATSKSNESLDAVFARADARMYACKQAHYASTGRVSRRMSNVGAMAGAGGH